MSTTYQFQLEFTEIQSDTLPVAAIVVAAGSGTRMGYNKQMALLSGVPVLARSLLAFEQAECIRDVVVVTREQEMADVQKLVQEYNITKVIAIVEGGAQRQDSVASGLSALAEDTVYVAIHDGARPLVEPKMIEAVVSNAKQTGAAALAVPLKDTVKLAEDYLIQKTLDRSQLWAMQTPQVFDLKRYLEAIAVLQEANQSVTDDCQVMEQAGYPVVITPGSYRNIKITTPEDMLIAQVLLGEEK